MLSRSPQPYLRRKGLAIPRQQSARFDPCDLLVHKYPTGATCAKDDFAEGENPPDRASLRPLSSVQ